MHRGTCIARRPRRHQVIRCVFAAGLHRNGLRRLRRVGCGELLEVRILGGAAVLLGLLKVTGRKRVQCELLFLRASDLESSPELTGVAGQRSANAR